ncbi:MAG: cation:dicarboxylase symporter family transporter [Treponema sp.]|nr:cation:dicarboxylase symporter family transporter [Treponema sp.]
MKIWLKYLIAALVGSAIALVLPASDAGASKVLSTIFGIAVHVGRYALIPLVFFSLPVAVFELNEDREFWKDLGRAALFLVISVLAFTLLGVLGAAIFHPARIPLVADSAAAIPVPGVAQYLDAIFPSSVFATLIQGDYLLPVCLLSVFLGLAFSHERALTKPAILVFDALSRAFYHINAVFAEFLGILIIGVSAWSVFELRSALSGDYYRPLLLVVGVETLVMALVIVPLALFLLLDRKNPYRYLYAILGPAIAGLMSGDAYFPLGSLMKHVRESLGVRRRASALALPLAAIFGRAGTVLVTATTFVVVLASYSDLGLSAGTLLWILGAAPLVTLLLGTIPGTGTMTALVALSALYGRGFENGYLIAVPVALPLSAAGAFLDIIWAGVVSLVLARREGYAKEREARFFI